MTTSEETSLRGRRHNPIDRVRASVRTLTLTQLCSRSPAPHWENAGKKQVDQRLVTNLKCLCRFHHLLKTFHGWTDHQYPDGTVAWTAPTGHTYVTKPEGAHWFPALGDPTGMPKVTEAPHAAPGRGRCMPTRTRTRVQERRDRVYTERYRNYLRIDEEAWEQQLATEHDPAPF